MKQLYTFLFMPCCKKYRILMGVCIGLELLYTIVSFAGPEVLRMATQAIEESSQELLRTCIILAVSSTLVYLALTSILKLLEKHTINQYEQGMQHAVLDQLFSLQKLRSKAYTSGDIITLTTQNIPYAVGNSLSYFFKIFQGIALILISIVYMGLLNMKLMLAMVGFNVIVRLFSTYFEKKIKASAKAVASTTKKNNGYLLDLLANILIIRVFNRQKHFTNKLLEKEQETMKVNWRNFNWANGFSEVIWFTLKAAQIGIGFGYGGYLVYKGETAFSVIWAFIFAIGLFTNGLNSTSSALAHKSNALPNIEPVTEFLQDKEVEKEIIVQHGPFGEFPIRFENVSFRFKGKEIFQNISFEIRPHEKVLIEGANGEGKSTLLHLIMGLYRPDSGAIYYGDHDIAGMSVADISQNYAYIPQNNAIAVGTAYENASLSDEYPQEELAAIFNRLNLEHVQFHAPQSYSQGEKQRLGIARAWLKAGKAKLIVGDEAFSNVDRENKNRIARDMFQQFADNMIIMVLHEEMNLKFDRRLRVANQTVYEICS